MCPTCAQKHVKLVAYLLDEITLIDNGRPPDRNDLRNYEWAWLGVIRDERMKVMKEEAEK